MAMPEGCTVAVTGGSVLLNLFTGVSTANPVGNAIPFSSVNLTLITGVSGQLGMQWAMGMSVTGIGFQDLFMGFGARGYGVQFIGDTLSFNGAVAGSGASTGVTANICTVGIVATCPAGNTYQAAVFNPPSIFSNTVYFPASTNVWLTKDPVVSVGYGGTSANMSGFTDTLHYTYAGGGDFPIGQVPEPSTFALVGGILVMAGLVRFRK